MKKRIQFRRRERTDLETQFWLRTFAFAIDFTIIRLLFIPIIQIGTAMATKVSNDETVAMVSMDIDSRMFWMLYIAVLVAYSSVMESSKIQGTIGKWFLRFQVCDASSKRISLPKALLRNTLKIISIFTVIGVFIIDMTPKRQALHDLIVGTVLFRR